MGDAMPEMKNDVHWLDIPRNDRQLVVASLAGIVSIAAWTLDLSSFMTETWSIFILTIGLFGISFALTRGAAYTIALLLSPKEWAISQTLCLVCGGIFPFIVIPLIVMGSPRTDLILFDAFLIGMGGFWALMCPFEVAIRCEVRGYIWPEDSPKGIEERELARERLEETYRKHDYDSMRRLDDAARYESEKEAQEYERRNSVSNSDRWSTATGPRA
jgi:hypothetical protein